MYSEKSPPEIIEVPSHVEYAPIKKEQTHIPEAKFEYEGNLPVRLRTETRSYEVLANIERTDSKEYFSHHAEFYDDGTLRSLTFKNSDAGDFIISMYRMHRQHTVGQMKEDIADDMHFENYDKPGGYSKTHEDLLANLQINMRSAAAYRGKSPDLTPIAQTQEVISSIASHGSKLYSEYFPETYTYDLSKRLSYINFPENDVLSNVSQEIYEWLQQIQAAEFPVTLQKCTIKSGKYPIYIKHIVLSDLQVPEDQQFLIEERVAEKAFFVADTLQHLPKRIIRIYDNMYFDTHIEGLRYVNRSKSEDITGTLAVYSRGDIFLNRRASSIIENVIPSEEGDIFETKRSIPSSASIGDIDHEIAHAFDTNIKIGTRPQVEAFAVCMELGFDFERTLAHLHEKPNYPDYISAERLTSIFSMSPPEQLKNVEIYRVSATFYSYVYEKLGPRNFTRFYDLLCGSSFETRKKRSAKLMHKIKMLPKELRYEGNIYACIDTLPKDTHWTWNSAQEFIDEYIEEVNKPFEKNFNPET